MSFPGPSHLLRTKFDLSSDETSERVAFLVPVHYVQQASCKLETIQYTKHVSNKGNLSYKACLYDNSEEFGP